MLTNGHQFSSACVIAPIAPVPIPRPIQKLAANPYYVTHVLYVRVLGELRAMRLWVPYHMGSPKHRQELQDSAPLTSQPAAAVVLHVMPWTLPRTSGVPMAQGSLGQAKGLAA